MTDREELNERGRTPGIASPDLPITEESISARLLNDAIANLRESIETPEGTAGPFLALARLVRGEVFRTNVGPDEDTRVEHSLGRVPTVVFASWAQDGRVGSVQGSADGGANSTPSNPVNSTAWTDTTAFVRATRFATWIFVLA